MAFRISRPTGLRFHSTAGFCGPRSLSATHNRDSADAGNACGAPFRKVHSLPKTKTVRRDVELMSRVCGQCAYGTVQMNRRLWAIL